MRNQILVQVLGNVTADWIRFSILPQPVGFLKFMLNPFCKVIFMGENFTDLIL